MNHDRLPHLLMGSIIFAIGLTVYLLEVKGAPGKIMALMFMGIGGVQAMIPGALPVYLIMVMFAPFWIWSYCFSHPIKKKQGAVVDDGGAPVIAWHSLGDRMVLVREFDVIDTIEGKSFFRGSVALWRMRAFLEKNNIPEFVMNEESLKLVMNEWNDDQEFLALARKIQRFKWTGDGHVPLIDFDKYNRASVDRMSKVIGLLWQSHKLSIQQKDDVIRLAIWYSLAVDVCYGGENKSFWDRIYT